MVLLRHAAEFGGGGGEPSPFRSGFPVSDFLSGSSGSSGGGGGGYDEAGEGGEGGGGEGGEGGVSRDRGGGGGGGRPVARAPGDDPLERYVDAPEWPPYADYDVRFVAQVREDASGVGKEGEGGGELASKWRCLFFSCTCQFSSFSFSSCFRSSSCPSCSSCPFSSFSSF